MNAVVASRRTMKPPLGRSITQRHDGRPQQQPLPSPQPDSRMVHTHRTPVLRELLLLVVVMLMMTLEDVSPSWFVEGFTPRLGTGMNPPAVASVAASRCLFRSLSSSSFLPSRLPPSSATTITATTTTTTTTTTTALTMCICVNCQWVTSCSAYHFVETQHNQPHMTDIPTFTPRDGSPTIELNIRTTSSSSKSSTSSINETEYARMWKEHESETERAMEQQQQQQQQQEGRSDDDDDDNVNNNDNVHSNTGSDDPPQLSPLMGVTKYDLRVPNGDGIPTVTYEFDVVSCADFILDEGCWVRNMPDEIRRANPNFVPT